MRHIPRLHISDHIDAQSDLRLSSDQSHYLRRVMRLEEGARIRVFNGRDGEWSAQVRVTGKSVSLTPLEQLRVQKNVPNLTLLFAPLKKARTDYAVEKATELGVARLQPVLTEYTQTNRIRTDRLGLLAIEAAEQTERLDIPEIYELQRLSAVLSAWDNSIPLYYCDEAQSQTQDWPARNASEPAAAGILIGPEGGFSPQERVHLRALEFVIPITLGPRILRAETAIVSALTLWQSKLGDWHLPPYLPVEETAQQARAQG